MPIIETDYEQLTPLIDALIEGQKRLKPGTLIKLEKQLESNEQNLAIRLKILGHYQLQAYKSEQNAENYSKHLIWLIDNFPLHPIHDYLFGPVQSKIVEQKIKARWLRQVRLNPNEPLILHQAATFCVHADARPKAIELWNRAIFLEPLNEDFPRELSFVYFLTSRRGTIARRKAALTLAVDYFFKALALHRKYPCDSYLHTYTEMIDKELAEVALELHLPNIAKKLGRVLVNLKPKTQTRKLRDGRKLQRTLYRHAAYSGHAILGKASILEGKVGAAKRRLELMCTLIFPQHYDWELAQQLLNCGKSDVVIKYMRACLQRIQKISKQVDQWAAGPNFVVTPPTTREQARLNWHAYLDAYRDKLLEQIPEIKLGHKPKLGEPW